MADPSKKAKPKEVPAPAKAKSGNSNEFIESELHNRIRAIEDRFDADCLGFAGPIVMGVDDIFRTAIEKRKANNGRPKLVGFCLYGCFSRPQVVV